MSKTSWAAHPPLRRFDLLPRDSAARCWQSRANRSTARSRRCSRAPRHEGRGADDRPPRVQLELVAWGYDAVVATRRRLRNGAARAVAPHLTMPAHHDMRASNVFLRRQHAAIAAAADRRAEDFGDLLLQPGVGARNVEVWALSCTARPVGLLPRRASPTRSATRTGTHSRCRWTSMMKPLASCARACNMPAWARDDRLAATRRSVDQARLREVPASVASRQTGPEVRARWHDGESWTGWAHSNHSWSYSDEHTESLPTTRI